LSLIIYPFSFLILIIDRAGIFITPDTCADSSFLFPTFEASIVASLLDFISHPTEKQVIGLGFGKS
jgi:hypothetical protein